QPPAASARGEEGVLAVGAVEQRADVALEPQRFLGLGGGVDQELLENRDAPLRGARLPREVLELGAVVEGEHRQVVPALALAADAMEPGEMRVLVRAIETWTRHEVLELVRRGHRSGAGVPRHHQRATGVRHPRRLAPARAGEPALEQAGHERVTGADDVHYP